MNHPSPNQAAASALEAEILRALDCAANKHGHNEIAAFDFRVDVAMCGSAVTLEMYAQHLPNEAQETHSPENDLAWEEFEQAEKGEHEIGVALANSDDIEQHSDGKYKGKIANFVTALNAYFEKEHLPLISNPILTKMLER